MKAEDWARLREVADTALKGLALPPYAVWLYGSRASGTENEESDFDFAVAAERRLDGPERQELRRRFEDALDAGGFGWPDIDVV
ncbi:MAG TPA: nucleotidyltransferase domain-containing protein [Rectinemataceae bacterium]|nr:nucleotidyltransferase domain-containing protein [Rectinemataceae bacterium]